MELVNKLADKKGKPETRKLLLKRASQWGFMFFAVKGVLWLVFSFSVVWFGVN